MLFDDYSRIDKKRRRLSRALARSVQDSSRRAFTSAEIVGLLQDHPELRLDADPASLQLARMLMADPEDRDMQEIFAFLVDNKNLAFINSGDEFWGNYPSVGSIVYPPNFIVIGFMPTGDPIGLTRSQLTGNVGVLGPTKSGKTTLLSILLSCRELLQTTRIVAFVKKPELRHLAVMPQVHGLILIFKTHELQLCLFEPPPGVPERAWNSEITRLTEQCYARFSSQRLFGDIIDDLMANHPQAIYPTLRQAVEVLNEFRPRFGMREAAYKESIVWVLKDLLNCTGSIWDHSSSDFLENLFSGPGLGVIELDDVPQEHFTFIATYMMRWIYFKRLYGSRVSL
jgi:hypothetical protein